MSKNILIPLRIQTFKLLDLIFSKYLLTVVFILMILFEKSHICNIKPLQFQGKNILFAYRCAIAQAHRILSVEIIPNPNSIWFILLTFFYLFCRSLEVIVPRHNGPFFMGKIINFRQRNMNAAKKKRAVMQKNTFRWQVARAIACLIYVGKYIYTVIFWVAALNHEFLWGNKVRYLWFLFRSMFNTFFSWIELHLWRENISIPFVCVT